jgi:hypothetical protein
LIGTGPILLENYSRRMGAFFARLRSRVIISRQHFDTHNEERGRR